MHNENFRKIGNILVEVTHKSIVIPFETIGVLFGAFASGPFTFFEHGIMPPDQRFSQEQMDRGYGKGKMVGEKIWNAIARRGDPS
jgi:hypothetical protein